MLVFTVLEFASVDLQYFTYLCCILLRMIAQSFILSHYDISLVSNQL